jgi:hypothetical protein
MKKVVFIFLSCVIPMSAYSQITFEDILRSVSEGLNTFNSTYNSNPATLREIGSVVLEANSTSNEFWMGGKSRNYCEVPLPEGTIKWFYRATVMPIESNYSYESNETLLYLLQNNKTVDLYAPSRYGVDLLFFDHSGEINSFYQGNTSFKSYQNLNRFNTRTTVGTIDFYKPKFWIGVRNNNETDGLKVIIEIVSLGYYNK